MLLLPMTKPLCSLRNDPPANINNDEPFVEVEYGRYCSLYDDDDARGDGWHGLDAGWRNRRGGGRPNPRVCVRKGLRTAVYAFKGCSLLSRDGYL